MSVSAHLRLDVADYDRRIRSFIPHYAEMLRMAASALRPRRQAPVIVDLGIGTGALAAACLRAVPGACLVGLDTDAEMLALAARRLRAMRRQGVVVGLERRSFVRGPLPRADYLTANISLHHIRTRPAKIDFYRRCRTALRPGGALVNADCMPPSEPALAGPATEQWIAHMTRAYTARQARGHLAAWASEDRYFPLDRELEMLEAAGLAPEVVWRRGAFAVVRGTRRARV